MRSNGLGFRERYQNPLETQVATATLRVRFQPQADLKVGLYEVRKLSPG